LGFFTYVGVFRFKPCITGEFMRNAPKFKNRFLKRATDSKHYAAEKKRFSKND
jgi:hypothetical protein